MTKLFYLVFLAALGAGIPALAGGVNGTDPTLIDKKVDPCSDYYRYACGEWLKKTPIPGDQSMWSRGFVSVGENNKKVLRTILEGYASGKPLVPNRYAGLLGDFYGACMDEKAVEKNGVRDFAGVLAGIDAIHDGASLAAEVAKLHLEGMNVLFSFSAEQDPGDSSRMIASADQGGLGLPDRDYYLEQTPKMKQIRGMYGKYTDQMMALDGASAKAAARVRDASMKIETALARASMSRVDRRDPKKVYHPGGEADLEKLAPKFDWKAYFKALGYTGLEHFDINVPDFFKGMNTLLASTSLDDLKAYLRWHALSGASSLLPKRFVDARFKFYSKALSGQKELPARWKRCVRATDELLGFALGRAFVEKTYGESGKALSKRIIEGVEQAFHHALESNAWMDAATRGLALKKLAKVDNKVGYPEKWRSYDGLKLGRASYLKNSLAAAEFGARYQLNKIDKPVDRTEWDMTPPTVNAYYDPSMNEMVFPAGILQPPFFNRDGDAPSNYGAIGMVMGHELTHGFDDEGRQFDASGNLKDWWTKSSADKFGARTDCLVKQYGSYKVLGDLHLNGKLTLGENIADNGGLKLGYAAWRATREGKSATPAQEKEFFLSMAQSWCTKATDQFQRMLVTIDPHSPAADRVNGTLSNFPEFSKTYGCKAGTPMNPVNRCEIW